MPGAGLIGRDQELATVADLVTCARRGRGGALLLDGIAGVGKTALLEAAAAAAAADGVTVLRARGLQAEAVLPYAGLADLLTPVLDLMPAIPAPRAAALRGALALDLPSGSDRFAVCAALLSLVATAAAKRPLLICIDDVQWVDAPSVEAICFAARRFGDLPAALVAAVRADGPVHDPADGPADGPADNPGHGLNDGPADGLLDGVPRLAVGGLSDAACAELLRRHRSRPISPVVEATIVSATGGNPLALTEVLDSLSEDQIAGRAALEDPLPVGPRLERALQRRLHVLPPLARRALAVAAAAVTADSGPIEAAIQRIGGGGLADLAPAEHRQIVTVGPSAVEFRHPLLRAAAYHDAPGSLRLLVHRALADSVDGVRADDQRAWHLAAATTSPDEQVAAVLEAAAGRARRGAGYAAAAAVLVRAARLTPDARHRAGRLLRAAGDAQLAGQLNWAGQLLDETRALSDDPALAISVDRASGPLMLLAGRPVTGQRLLTGAGERAAATDPEQAADILAEAAFAATGSGQTSAALLLARRAAALLPAGTDRMTCARVQLIVGYCLALGGPATEALALLDTHQLWLESAGSGIAENHLALALGTRCRTWLGDYAAADVVIERNIGVFRDSGAVVMLATALYARSELRYWTGQWPEALVDIAEAVEWAAEIRQPSFKVFALGFQARLQAACGDHAGCRATAADIARQTTGSELGPLSGYYPTDALGFLELGLGRPHAAIVELERVRAFHETNGWTDPSVVPWLPDLVECYLRTGRVDAGRDALAVLERQAAAGQRSWPAAAAARYRGVLAPSEDGSDAAFAAALALHEQTRTPFERARTLLCWGERLRRDRRRSQAREPLREALDTFDRLGARPWARRAAAELAGTGARRTVNASPAVGAKVGASRVRPSAPRLPWQRDDPGIGSLESLTPQETQVARHVATGMTNPEVAAALFLTRKTVEFHLANVYRKLGLRGRTELAALLATSAAEPLPVRDRR